MKTKKTATKNTWTSTARLSWQTPTGRERSKDFEYVSEAEKYASKLARTGQSLISLKVGMTLTQLKRRVAYAAKENKASRKFGYTRYERNDWVFGTTIWANNSDPRFLAGFIEGARLGLKESA